MKTLMLALLTGLIFNQPLRAQTTALPEKPATGSKVRMPPRLSAGQPKSEEPTTTPTTGESTNAPTSKFTNVPVATAGAKEDSTALKAGPTSQAPSNDLPIKQRRIEQKGGEVLNPKNANAKASDTEDLNSNLHTTTEKNTSTAKQEPTPTFKSLETAFLAGIKHFQDKQYELAKSAFIEATRFNNNSLAALYNLGLAAEKTNDLGLALGAWRRALYLDPQFSKARKRMAALTQEHNSLRSPAKNSLGHLQNLATRFIGLDTTIGAMILFLAATLFFWIRWLGARKVAFEEDQELPNYPNIGYAWFIGFLFFLLCSSIITLKRWPTQGTIVVAGQKGFTTPSLSASDLFEFSLGENVSIENHHKDWLQVKHPDGIPGWVPSSSIFIHQGQVQ